ncbi:hypothetical protein [Candidatus Uabimicrobium sp. HlEnr_7]|uniref:hypothetical protein n=1 Tax=Candidatus Uabimicrobium helgolandensis TaxID=3095367 RepID=UPI0035588AA7
MKIVAFTAQSFGFGPVRKMIAIAEKLNGVYKIFFGSGVAYDFAKAHFFDEYHYLKHNEDTEILSILNRSNIFINVMDFELGGTAKKSSCQCIVVDSLLWFYPFRPDVDYADYYFVQDFFRSSRERLKQYSIKNARIIGPIVEYNEKKYKIIKQCIINFGGSDGKVCNSHIAVGKNTNYPFIILRVLLPLLRIYFKNILVVGRQSVVDACSERFAMKNVSFVMLKSKDMLKELSRSQALFSVPGIHSFLDAADKLPIFFLPPSNHSHLENLDVFIEHAVTTSYFSWSQYYKLQFGNTMSRQQKIDTVLQTINHFDRDYHAQQELQKIVRSFIENEGVWSQTVLQQKKKLQSLGENGLEAIIITVKELLQSLNNEYAHNKHAAV